MAKKDDLWRSDSNLLGRDGGAGMKESVENAMYIVKMLPDEASYLGVSRDHLEPTILSFIMSRGPLDTGVVHKGLHGVQNLRFEDKSNVTMEDGHCPSPSLWQAR